ADHMPGPSWPHLAPSLWRLWSPVPNDQDSQASEPGVIHTGWQLPCPKRDGWGNAGLDAGVSPASSAPTGPPPSLRAPGYLQRDEYERARTSGLGGAVSQWSESTLACPGVGPGSR